MGRGAIVERALRDVVELRTLAHDTSDESTRARLEQIAQRRSEDIGPSVPKTRAARMLGVSLTALDRWIGRGAIPVLERAQSSRREVETGAVVELAVEIRVLGASRHERAPLAAVLARRRAAGEDARRAPMGTRGFFPDQDEERRQELALLTPGERVAQAIGLSRAATRIAAAAAPARERSRARRTT